MQLSRFSRIQKNKKSMIMLAYIVQLLFEKEKNMASKTLEKVSDKIILDDDFNLAFKLVFFDENDEEVEPAQYKALSTFSVEREMSIQQ